MKSVATDGDWTTWQVLRGAYEVVLPGELSWSPDRKEGYAAYESDILHDGRIYTLWVHRYPKDSAALRDPNLVDDNAAAFGLVHGVPTPPRMDFKVAHGTISGRAVRFTFPADDGATMYQDLVVFKVGNDVVFQGITAKGAYAPIEDFKRMNEGFRVL